MTSSFRKRSPIQHARQSSPGITDLPQSRPLEPRQHLVAEVRQFVAVVDERHGNAGETGGTQVDELPRHVIRIADDRQTAVAVRELAALRGELFGRHGLRGDIAHGEQPVDGRPVGLIHHAISVVIVRLPHRRPAGDDTDGVDADLASLLPRQLLDPGDPLRGLRHRYP